MTPGDLRDPDHGERPGDGQAVHRGPDRLHRGGDPPGGDGHLLLDPLHLQRDAHQRQLPGAPRGGGGARGPGRVPLPQVLPVGLLHALLPGAMLLHPQVGSQ